jgi:hypothetical protein
MTAPLQHWTSALKPARPGLYRRYQREPGGGDTVREARVQRDVTSRPVLIGECQARGRRIHA